MSAAERRWWIGFVLAAIVVVGWLNGAATVDWSLLRPRLAVGSAGAWALVAVLAVILVGALGLAILCWTKARRSFNSRG